MDSRNPYPLTAYQELEPLCEKWHVVLVQNLQDGQLYVKKRIQSYAPQLYLQLRDAPVKNTPAICGIYKDPAPAAPVPGAAGLIIIEEYLPGHTLAEHLRDNGLFPEQMCFDIGMQLCRILMELHSRKPAIIHRDIKPSNVMLLPDGSVKLIDFGAAKTVSDGEKRDTVLIGTAGFAAPEQYGFSASTPQTDLYALGVLLNTLLTGVLPWEKEARGQLSGVISRCLKMDPKSRYAGAWELYDALKRAKKQRICWLPPGFRTLRWYKMIPALLWYLFVFLCAFGVDFKPTIEPQVRVGTRMIFLVLGLLPVFFYANYMDMQRFFPLMRSSRRGLRLIGLAIAPAFMLFLTLVLLVIVAILYL